MYNVSNNSNLEKEMAERKKKRRSSESATTIILAVIFAALVVCFTGDRLFGRTAPKVTDGVEFHFIDVGQGDSTLIRTPSGNILVDAGENSAERDLKNYLDICGVETIEYAVFTHPDSDHIGGADMVLKEYKVNNVIMSDADGDSAVFRRLEDAIAEEGCPVYYALPGETYSLGEFDMFIFSPDPNAKLDSNNSSLVIKATWGDTTAMLTGDAEKPAEESILATYSGAELGSMLLKMGHHGSRTSSTDAWLAAVKPKIAVISCGLNNSYGHPHPEALARIKAYVGDSIYRTDELGSIVFITDGTTFTYQDRYGTYS